MLLQAQIPKRYVFKDIAYYMKYNVQNYLNLDQIKIQNITITSLGSKSQHHGWGGRGQYVHLTSMRICTLIVRMTSKNDDEKRASSFFCSFKEK